MKRAAILCIAIATLLLALPSTPLQADTQLNGKYGSSASVSAAGPSAGPGVTGGGTGGGGGGGGGADEGDADGLSGMKIRPPLTGSAGAERTMVFVRTWWKFMILLAR